MARKLIQSQYFFKIILPQGGNTASTHGLQKINKIREFAEILRN